MPESINTGITLCFSVQSTVALQDSDKTLHFLGIPGIMKGSEVVAVLKGIINGIPRGCKGLHTA